MAQEVPFTGVVKLNQTDVRAGAADRYYRVGELNKGRLVQVDEVIVGWYKIVPPQGIYSYISKAFVDAKGDGSTGVVNTDRSKVRAADMNGAAGSYRIQAILNEGDGVQIVAEEGSHYKIVSPPDAYVYLPPGSVRRALAIEMEAAAEPSQPEAPQPVVEPQPIEPEPVVVVPVEPEPVVEAPVVPDTPEPPAVTEPQPDDQAVQVLQEMLNDPADEPAPAVEAQSLAELEAQMQAMLELPVEDRPLDEMIAKYELLEAAGGLSQSDAHRVASRLALLRHDQQISQGLIAIAQAREPQPDTPAPQAEAVSYDAVGRLMASSVYDGKTLPRMYRLVDPATSRAVAYIRPGGPVEATRFLGRLVGVQGDRAYDPVLKLNVITVKHIDALEAAD